MGFTNICICIVMYPCDGLFVQQLDHFLPCVQQIEPIQIAGNIRPYKAPRGFYGQRKASSLHLKLLHCGLAMCNRKTINEAELLQARKLDILGTRDDGIVEIDICGWITAESIPSFNAALKAFDYNTRGMILDYRNSVISISPEEVRLFTHMPDCPVAHVIGPEHERFAGPFIKNLRSYGYKRMKTHTREDAERWLYAAIRQNSAPTRPVGGMGDV